MQDQAFVVALNFVVFLCCIRVCCAYGSWVWTAKKELSQTAMGMLPFSVFFLSAAVGLEALYYGSARILATYSDINLWEQAIPVNTIRIILILGALFHMIPYWRTIRRDCVACWAGVDAAVYGIFFIGLTWWLY